MRLPLQIRLQVYEHALVGQGTHVVVHALRSAKRDQGPFEQMAPFECTIDCSGPLEKDINTALLSTTRQIHIEAEPIFYQNHQFKFGEYLQEGVAFLQSISKVARLNIRSISMLLFHWHKRPMSTQWELKLVRDWIMACHYVAKNLRLHKFTFDTSVKAVAKDFKAEPWVRALVQIKGLQELAQSPAGSLVDSKSSMSKDGDWDECPDIVLNARLAALLVYLRSEMLAHPPSQLEEEGEGWKVGWDMERL